jgi:hypothetical protein
MAGVQGWGACACATDTCKARMCDCLPGTWWCVQVMLFRCQWRAHITAQLRAQHERIVLQAPHLRKMTGQALQHPTVGSNNPFPSTAAFPGAQHTPKPLPSRTDVPPTAQAPLPSPKFLLHITQAPVPRPNRTCRYVFCRSMLTGPLASCSALARRHADAAHCAA